MATRSNLQMEPTPLGSWRIGRGAAHLNRWADDTTSMMLQSFRSETRISVCTLLPLVVVGVVSCGASNQQRLLAQKAVVAARSCNEVGDKFFQRPGTVMVWDLERDALHAAHDLINDSLNYQSEAGPVTVFLVGARRSSQVGSYSVSGQPAFREWVDVCAVSFSDSSSAGTPVAMHEVVSLDPRQARPVSQAPEHGDPAPPIAAWVGSLRPGNFAEAALGSVRDSQYFHSVGSALQNEDVFVRLATVKALGVAQDSRAVEALLRALQDPIESVRIEAILALGKTGDTRALRPLADFAANATFPSTQLAAQRALDQLRSTGR